MCESLVTPEVRLANDIAVQFHHMPADAAAKAVATHIGQFWERRMREHLFAQVDAGDTADLDPVALAAVALLRR
ncbi:MAG: formate dehydrogenase subunit delta [Streptosporangiales bacterium]|nr:formate dehydrogenase subunit delta [Streptosporangiales bacterium]